MRLQMGSWQDIGALVVLYFVADEGKREERDRFEMFVDMWRPWMRRRSSQVPEDMPKVQDQVASRDNRLKKVEYCIPSVNIIMYAFPSLF